MGKEKYVKSYVNINVTTTEWRKNSYKENMSRYQIR